MLKKYILLAVFSLVIFSCKDKQQEEVATVDENVITVTEEQFSSSNMKVETPMEQDFDVTIKTSGKINVIVNGLK